MLIKEFNLQKAYVFLEFLELDTDYEPHAPYRKTFLIGGYWLTANKFKFDQDWNLVIDVINKIRKTFKENKFDPLLVATWNKIIDIELKRLDILAVIDACFFCINEIKRIKLQQS